MSRRWMIAGLGSMVIAGVWFRRGTRARRVLERARRRLKSRGRHGRGVVQGVWYRLRRRHPDEDVIAPVLADRIRSTLGLLERRLDLPHIRVMVHDHTAVLHGDVATESDRDALVAAVRKVPGVHEVDCHLHVGLLSSDTRPSQGRAVVRPSAARRALEVAARRGGSTGPPEHAVRAVLGTFLGRIPRAERDQVLAHLPADVRSLTTSDAEDARLSSLATVHALLDAIAEVDPSLDRNRARGVTDEVLAELAVLVPEERADIVAVLPWELKELFERAQRRAGTVIQ